MAASTRSGNRRESLAGSTEEDPACDVTPLTLTVGMLREVCGVVIITAGVPLDKVVVAAVDSSGESVDISGYCVLE